MSRLPSSLTRSQASGGTIPTRKKVTAADIAMMTSEEYKSYLKSRGEWPEQPEFDRDNSFNPQRLYKPSYSNPAPPSWSKNK